jgi:hypothetical protein
MDCGKEKLTNVYMQITGQQGLICYCLIPRAAPFAPQSEQSNTNQAPFAVEIRQQFFSKGA